MKKTKFIRNSRKAAPRAAAAEGVQCAARHRAGCRGHNSLIPKESRDANTGAQAMRRRLFGGFDEVEVLIDVDNAGDKGEDDGEPEKDLADGIKPYPYSVG